MAILAAQPAASELPDEPRSAQAATLRKQAEDASSAKNWPLAVTLWSRYVGLEAKDATGFMGLGQAFENLGRLDSAIDTYKQASEVFPDAVGIWTTLCWKLIVVQRTAEARSPCQKALDLDTSSWVALVNLGHAYLLSGDAATAQLYYARALRLIGSEDELKEGPLDDLAFFIQKGWQLDASRAAMEWFKTEAARAGPLVMAQRALEETEKIKGPDSLDVRFRLNILADLHENMGESDKALPLYERALAISEKALGPEHSETGTSLNNLAVLYEAMGQYDKALPLYVRVLAIREKTEGRDHPRTLVNLSNLAQIFRVTGQYDKALPLAARALSISERSKGPDHPDTGERLSDLATLYFSMGKFDLAQPLFARALTISEKTKGAEHAVTAIRLNDMAAIHEAFGQYNQALPLYSRALAISEKVHGPEHASTGGRLNNLAGLLEKMGEFEKALPLLARAVTISEKLKGAEHPDTGIRLNNMALLHHSMGRYDRALPLFLRAVAITEKVHGPVHSSMGIRLSNLASLHESMGRYDLALPLISRALEISEKSQGPVHPDTAIRLNNLGGLLQKMGEGDKALAPFLRALEISELVFGPEHPLTGSRLNNVAALYVEKGQHDKALPLLYRALAISEKSEGAGHPNTGTRLNNLASLYQLTGQFEQALPLSLKAYSIANRAGDPNLAAIVQNNLARIFRELNRQDLAIFFGKESVNTIQSLRANSKGFDRASQEALIQSKKGIYESLAQWLIEAGRLAEAQQVLGLLKEDELLDFSVRSGAGDPLQARVSFLAREADWQRQSNEAVSELDRLNPEIASLRKIPETDRTPEQGKMLEALLSQADKAQANFADVLARIQSASLQTRPQANEKAVTSAELPARAQTSLGPLLSRLAVEGAARPAALQYLVTEHKVYVLLTLPQKLLSKEIVIASKDLRQQIGQFRRALRDPAIDPRPQAQALYQLLIAPVASELEQAGVEHLMVSLTDALRYIPFPALHDGSQYLMQKYQLSMLTEAALGMGMNKPHAAWRVAALGVAAKVSPEFAALPAVAGELGSIVRSAINPAGAFPGQVYLDDQFTAQRYRQVIEDGQPVIHLATHFKFSPGVESQNYLLLGDGQSLSLSDMMSRQLRFQNLDLLTLSACETGLGAVAGAQGREVESLGARAQLQGASAVIATLWQVADESTGQLMKIFYSIRASNPGMNKAEAMRRAQIALLEGKVDKPTPDGAARSATARVPQAKGQGTRFQTDAARPYAHPFYWAPFVLMGNWL